MAATVIAFATATGTGGSINGPVPGTPVAGDLWFCAVSVDDNSCTINVPGGWTAVGSQVSSFPSTLLMYKVCAGGESAQSFTITSGAGSNTAFSFLARGVDSTTPIGEVSSWFTDAASGNTIDAPDIGNVDADGSLVIEVAQHGAQRTYTPPSGGTLIGTVNDTTASFSLAVAQVARDTGAYAPGNWTLSGSSPNRSTLTFVVRGAVVAQAVVPIGMFEPDLYGGLELLEKETATSLALLDPDFIEITAGGGVAGDLSATQASQTSAASGTVAVAGSATPTQGSQTSSAAGAVAIVGNSARTQAAQTLASAGVVTVGGALSKTQAAQTLVSAATVTVGAAATPTQAAQTSSSAGTVSVAGALSRTQAGDTSSAAGTHPVTGSASPTQANNTLASAGAVAVSGASSRTQAAQTAASTGAVLVAANLAKTQDPHTLAATGGNPAIIADLSATQGAQTLASAGAVAGSASLSRTQANQTTTSSGTVSVGVTVAATQASQTSNAAGTIAIIGAAVMAQASQSLTVAGSPVVGASLARTQDDHTLFASDARPGGLLVIRVRRKPLSRYLMLNNKP